MPAVTDEYGRIARYYDAVTGRLLAGSRQALARSALELGAVSKGSPLLDLGCGTGLQMLEYLRLGLPCIGVDASLSMLNVAEKNLHGFVPEQKKRASLVLGRGESLPFADDSFSAVSISLLLHESTAGQFSLLDEALRLAPRLFILDWRMPERNLDYAAHLLVRVIERLAGRRHYRSFSSFMAQGALEGMLQRYSAYRKAHALSETRVSQRAHLAGGMLLLITLERK